MFISENIVGKRFLKMESVVELLKGVEEKDNLFADFPIGTIIQDGGKRKRSNDAKGILSVSRINRRYRNNNIKTH